MARNANLFDFVRPAMETTGMMIEAQ